jgi:hypothetical protein
MSGALKADLLPHRPCSDDHDSAHVVYLHPVLLRPVLGSHRPWSKYLARACWGAL